MKYNIKQIKNIDTSTFRFDLAYQNPVAMAAETSGNYYQISGFGSAVAPSEFITLNFIDIYQVLDFVCEMQRVKTISALAKVALACKKLSLDYNKVDIFKKNNIKGRNSFETLLKISALEHGLLQFIDEKGVNLKLLALLVFLNDKKIKFIADFVAFNSPTLQSFKNFVQNVADFENIDYSKYDKGFEFPTKKTKEHIEIDSSLAFLKSAVSPIKIDNLDNFETPFLQISSSVKNMDEFENFIKNLEKNKENLADFFKILEQHDLY